jgi:hypothetical protein
MAYIDGQQFVVGNPKILKLRVFGQIDPSESIIRQIEVPQPRVTLVSYLLNIFQIIFRVIEPILERFNIKTIIPLYMTTDRLCSSTKRFFAHVYRPLSQIKHNLFGKHDSLNC